jgi:hypothetical protein
MVKTLIKNGSPQILIQTMQILDRTSHVFDAISLHVVHIYIENTSHNTYNYHKHNYKKAPVSSEFFG